MLKVGFKSLLDPACAGLVTPALRDALFVGLFQGPRITCAGPALTSRQGLYDYFPSWIGVPPVSTGTLVTSRAEAIETIRRQTKDGVDIIKIAMDGIQGGNSGGLYAAFDQDETTAMVRETHRLGRKVVVHARGREGALYAARAGVDIIYHASRTMRRGYTPRLARAVPFALHCCCWSTTFNTHRKMTNATTGGRTSSARNCAMLRNACDAPMKPA